MNGKSAAHKECEVNVTLSRATERDVMEGAPGISGPGSETQQLQHQVLSPSMYWVLPLPLLCARDLGGGGQARTRDLLRKENNTHRYVLPPSPLSLSLCHSLTLRHTPMSANKVMNEND